MEPCKGWQGYLREGVRGTINMLHLPGSYSAFSILMGPVAIGDEMRKPVEKFSGSSCWPMGKRFTTRFLIDLLGGRHKDQIFF